MLPSVDTSTPSDDGRTLGSMFSVRNRHVWVRRPFHSRELGCQGLVHYWLEDGSAFVTWVDESGVVFTERVDADRLVTVDASPNVGSMYG